MEEVEDEGIVWTDGGKHVKKQRKEIMKSGMFHPDIYTAKMSINISLQPKNYKHKHNTINSLHLTRNLEEMLHFYMTLQSSSTNLYQKSSVASVRGQNFYKPIKSHKNCTYAASIRFCCST